MCMYICVYVYIYIYICISMLTHRRHCGPTDQRWDAAPVAKERCPGENKIYIYIYIYIYTHIYIYV